MFYANAADESSDTRMTMDATGLTQPESLARGLAAAPGDTKRYRMKLNFLSHVLAPAKATISCLAILALLVSFPLGVKAQAPPVPSTYQDLYTELDNYLVSFNTTLSASGNGSTYPYMVTGNLMTANGNIGPQLLTGLPGVQVQINSLKAMGAPAVMIELPFPVLYQPFLASQGQNYTAFVTYYQQVANMVRAAGMKLVIENDSLQSNEAQSGWDVSPYYSTLNWTQYQQARAAMALTIVQTMQPDYLTLLEEPDTEANNSGQANVNTASGATSLLSQMLTSVQQANLPNVKVGAGVGSWLTGYNTFISSFVTMPINFIDIHIYPVNDGFLNNALTIASMAQAAGLPVAMTECWLRKVRDSELNVLTNDQLLARNVFSFWEPLDAYYLQTVESFANSTQMIFLNPFETNLYYAYQDYNDTTMNLTPAQLLTQEDALANTAMPNVVYTPMAASFYNSIVTPADTTPPTTPSGLTGISGNPTSAYITWNSATDNVGVAGYYVFRNGVSVGTTAYLFYQDNGLVEATTYAYTVQAFDFAGNVSPASVPVSVLTTEATPPTTPGNVTSAVLSCYRGTVSWAASTDKIGISSYLIFEGSSPGSLTQIGMAAGTSTSYGNNTLSPGTTYYFAVQAKDKSSNVSYLSPVISLTTPQVPAAPASVLATPASTTRVTLSWAAPTGGLPISVYHIYRGSSPTSMTLLATVNKTSYTDSSVTAATTYYYAIQAVDSGTPPAQSALSAPVSVTTYSAPSTPTNVVATASSATKVTVTWNASASGGLPIAGYHIYRGSSAANLAQVAIRTTPSYIDTTVVASTTYVYAVQTGDTQGNLSAMSATATVTTDGPPQVPANLVATPVSASKVTLTWSAAVSGGLPIASYHVYSGPSPSSLTQLAVTTSTTYNNTSLNPGTVYYYAVLAADSAGENSALSNPVSTTTLSLPSTPTNIATQGVSTTQIMVTWSPSTGSLPVTYYHVLRGATQTNMSQVATTSKTTYYDSTATSGTVYYYQVQAVDSAGDLSPLSAPVTGTTK